MMTCLNFAQYTTLNLPILRLVTVMAKPRSQQISLSDKSAGSDKPAGSGSLKNKSHLGLDELNALDLLSPPCGNGLALLDKVLATCSINESSPNAHALFVASRIA